MQLCSIGMVGLGSCVHYPINITGMNSSIFDTMLHPGVNYSAVLVAVYSNNARAKSLPAHFTTLVNGINLCA